MSSVGAARFGGKQEQETERLAIAGRSALRKLFQTRGFGVVLLAAGGLTLAQGQQAAKVGVMNVQAAIASSKDGQKAAGDLETKFGPKKKDVEAKQNQIAGLKDQLQKGQNTMSEAAKADLARNIDIQSKRLQRDMEDDEAELNQDQQKAIQSIYQKMQVVIDKYAKDNGFTLILDVNPQQNLVVYASNTIDVTKAIVDLYDKNTVPTPAGTPAPVAPAPKPAPPKPATPSGKPGPGN